MAAERKRSGEKEAKTSSKYNISEEKARNVISAQ
jgi:hypothetical protein